MKYMYANKLKSIGSTFTGSISSIIPLFFACCKSGACVGVCASPIASIFGISSASFTASPLFNAIVPLLIAFSAISFTVSYYNLYVLPKINACKTDCNCETPQSKRKEKISKWIFWIGLVASIFFFTYFEAQKYNANKTQQAQVPKIEIIYTNKIDSLNNIDSTKVEEPCCSGDGSCE